MTALREVAGLFLKLGVVGFGGPAAHIALMDDEVVARRQWLTRQRFLDVIGVTNLIPGPNSTEIALHLGFIRAGWAGLIVAGACFIVPAAVLSAVLAALYVRYGSVPAVGGVLMGIKPVALAIVVHAAWRLGRVAGQRRPLLGVMGLAAAAGLLGANEIAVLAAGALLGLVIERGVKGGVSAAAPFLAAAAAAPSVPTLTSIGLFFLKIGSVLYGSGYVLVSFLRSGLVVERGWLTERQLLDVVAIGQLTPGPFLSTATAIGYVLQGPLGAAVATVGIFLPAFVFVALLAPRMERIHASRTATAVLGGLNAASVGLIAAAAVSMAKEALPSPSAVLLGLVAFVLLWKTRMNAALLVVAAGVLGWMLP
ncbi:MAG: chromate efflux transporter [Gemmatimonadota bacterium]